MDKAEEHLPRAGVASLQWVENFLWVRREDGKVLLWSHPKGEQAALTGSQGPVAAVCPSRQGGKVVTLGVDGSAWLREKDGNPVCPLTGHSAPVKVAAWSAHGEQVVTQDGAGLIRLWDAGGGLIEVLEAAPVGSLAWHPSEHRLVTGGTGMVLSWTGHRGELQGRHMLRLGGTAVSLAWSRPEACLAVATEGRLEILSPKLTVLSDLATGGIVDMAWSRQTHRLGVLTEGGGHILKWFSVQGMSAVVQSGEAHDVRSFAWCPGAEQVAVQDIHGRVFILDRDLEPENADGIAAAAFAWSTNGDRLATGDEGGEVGLWTPKGARVQAMKGHTARITCLSWGQALASGDADGGVILWSRDGVELARVLPVHRAAQPPPAPQAEPVVPSLAPPAVPAQNPDSQGDPEPGLDDVEDLHAHNDAAIVNDGEDKLGYAMYADVLAPLIKHPKTKRPLTIAINGPWGSGKSSLANLVLGRLAPAWAQEQATGKRPPDLEDEHLVCWFNAWEHDADEGVEQAFMRKVARTAQENRGRWAHWFRPVPWAIRTPRQKMATATLFATLGAAAGILLYLALTWPDFPTTPKALYTLLVHPTTTWPSLARSFEGLTDLGQAWIAVLPAGLLAVFRRLGVAAALPLKQFVTDAKEDSKEGDRDGLKEAIGKLIDGAVRKDGLFLVVVDDLDRCRPQSAVSLLESVRLLQKSDRVVVILLADLATLASCVEAKYETVVAHDMAHTGVGHERSEGRRRRAASEGEALEEESWQEARTRMVGTFGARYIQKFVQVQFDLPPISRHHVGVLLDHHAAPATHRGEEVKRVPA